MYFLIWYMYICSASPKSWLRRLNDTIEATPEYSSESGNRGGESTLGRATNSYPSILINA